MKWLLLALLNMVPLCGEIQLITVTWVPWQMDVPACNPSCGMVIQDKLSRLPGVAGIDLKLSAGQVDIRWQPNVPFSYQQIDAVMRIAGPGIAQMRIKAKGTIIHDSRTVSLISIGDNTRFILVGPLAPPPNPNQMVIQENVATHPLPESLKAELLMAEQANLPVTVEGPLLLPEQSPPMYLIVERKQIDKPQERPSNPRPGRM